MIYKPFNIVLYLIRLDLYETIIEALSSVARTFFDYPVSCLILSDYRFATWAGKRDVGNAEMTFTLLRVGKPLKWVLETLVQGTKTLYCCLKDKAVGSLSYFAYLSNDDNTL